MTSQAKMATGILIAYNGTVYAELLDVTDPPFAVEKVDATTHDSTHHINIPGESSFGDLTFRAEFVNDTAQAALRALAIIKTIGTWSIIYPSAFSFLTYTIPGFVSSLKHTTPMKGTPATVDITITPTESVTEVTTAGAALTTPFVTITDNTPTDIPLTPTASATTYVLDGTALQAAIHLHVTPTATTGTIYVDGTIVATGAPSGPIAYALADFPTGSIKTIFVMVLESAAKTPRVYRIRITRGAA